MVPLARNLEADGMGQTDVGGLYAYVMLQAFDLTDDKEYLDDPLLRRVKRVDEMSSEQHGTRLEVIIILLIAVEVIFEVRRIVIEWHQEKELARQVKADLESR